MWEPGPSRRWSVTVRRILCVEHRAFQSGAPLARIALNSSFPCNSCGFEAKKLDSGAYDDMPRSNVESRAKRESIKGCDATFVEDVSVS